MTSRNIYKFIYNGIKTIRVPVNASYSVIHLRNIYRLISFVKRIRINFLKYTNLPLFLVDRKDNAVKSVLLWVY